jgi:hypothetical protein
VRVWLFPQASESQIRFAALFVYGLLWVLVVVLMNLAVPKPA